MMCSGAIVFFLSSSHFSLAVSDNIRMNSVIPSQQEQDNEKFSTFSEAKPLAQRQDPGTRMSTYEDKLLLEDRLFLLRRRSLLLMGRWIRR